jgi:peptide-methionine (S)-S-oxide reductase
MKLWSFFIIVFVITACNSANNAQSNPKKMLTENNNLPTTTPPEMNDSTEYALVGGGCFWCVEAIYQRLQGVTSVESGYAGGHVKNPSYEAVCNKTTGHAEVALVRFDPRKTTYEEVLQVFFRTHDPTTPNRQGNDVGPQYRSSIFYFNEKQKEIAEKVAKEYATQYWSNPIITEITAFSNYYKAENYHQNYYNDNKRQGYCVYVVQPKVEKFKKEFKEKLKQE